LLNFDAVDFLECCERVVIRALLNIFLHNLNYYFRLLLLKGNEVSWVNFEIIEGLERVDDILFFVVIYEISFVAITEANNADTILV